MAKSLISSHSSQHQVVSRTAGFSLIELMVAIAIGLALVTLVVQGYATSSGNARVNSLVSEYQTNGRYALEVLKREARHAAMHPLVWDTGTTGSDPQVTVNLTAAARDFGCGAGVTTDVMAGIAAWDVAGALPGSLNCVNVDSTYLRGDLLLLRRASWDPAPVVAGAPQVDLNAPYLRVSYSVGNVYLGGETPVDWGHDFFSDYRLVSDLYFINDYTNSSSETPKVPALYRMTLETNKSNPELVPELVASNVEHLQIQFGEMDALGNVRYHSAGTVGQWPNVVSMRIWLLLRASTTEPGFASGSYDLAGEVYTPTPADSFRRTVLSTTINLRNK